MLLGMVTRTVNILWKIYLNILKYSFTNDTVLLYKLTFKLTKDTPVIILM